MKNPFKTKTKLEEAIKEQGEVIQKLSEENADLIQEVEELKMFVEVFKDEKEKSEKKYNKLKESLRLTEKQMESDYQIKIKVA